MNKNIIYLVVSVIAVLCTAWLVVSEESEYSDDEITVTVMNTDTVISGTAETTTILKTTEKTKTHNTTTTNISYTKTTVVAKDTVVNETAISSISTNTEYVTTYTEPVTTVFEEIYVNINTADIDELMQINGIGEVIATEIISYREQNGGFRNIEEIMNVYGIGEARFERMRNFIYVENPVYYDDTEVTEEETEPEIFPEPETEPEITLQDVAPININTADIELLTLLPYVDEQIAQDIITMREMLNGFSHVYELLYVEKLEQKEVAEMEEFVTVGQ
ncbi:MAG: ComEA family DNA-binding protein [Ruminococcus sp.]|nr:ComEA family DNA-binding protein [Ruminococcus sp.]